VIATRLRRIVGSVWFRLLVTILLLGVVATLVDWSAAADHLDEGSWVLFATAVTMLFVSQVIAGLRWRLLLRGAGLERPLPATIRAYLVGTFANNFLPTSFGGDFARAWLLAKPGPPLVRALLSVVVDRFMAFWCLVAIAWIALAVDPDAVPTSLALALLGVTVAGLAASALLLRTAMHGGDWLARRLPERVLGWARETRETLHLYRRGPRVLVLATLLGLAFQALAVFTLWVIAKSIDIEVPVALLAVVAPLGLVITLIPISIAGFGVREGGMVLLLGEAGYSATEATLLTLVGLAALVVSSLPGAAAMLAGSTFPSRDELEAAEEALRGGVLDD
jgi:glycosyltransferase 2 family protein